MSASVDTIRNLAEQDYKWGFVTEIDEDRVPKGLNEETIRLISARKGEPEFMLEWRLNALRRWSKMERAAVINQLRGSSPRSRDGFLRTGRRISRLPWRTFWRTPRRT